VREYIEIDNPSAAPRQIELMETKVNHLRALPMLGRMGRRPAIRELPIQAPLRLWSIEIQGGNCCPAASGAKLEITAKRRFACSCDFICSEVEILLFTPQRVFRCLTVPNFEARSCLDSIQPGSDQM
jgi:hypothetical protein